MLDDLGGPGVDVLGFGDAVHGGEEFPLLRNRLFDRLGAAHGFTAVAAESGFPRGRAAGACRAVPYGPADVHSRPS